MAIFNKVSHLLKSGLPSKQLIRGFSCQSHLLTPKKADKACSGVPNVPGLSKKVVEVPCEKVGPGASKDGEYKHPEYFCFNKISYYEAEIEMADFRLPQPSSKH